MAPVKPKDSIPSYEAAFERLEQIADLLERGDLALEASMDAFEEGMKLVDICMKQIEAADLRLNRLIKDSEGRFQTDSIE
ncbi:exodeoxyribonuclease VII small subunit [bacterium]|nr:exodeoxyribonuclease VII small subunit [bacterium]